MRPFVPVLAVLHLLQLSATALAVELTPLAATELLSKSYFADRRCRFLKSAEHDELRRYVEHAELAAAELEGRSSTRTAMEDGRTSGAAAECSPATRQQTISTLAAARRAMAAAGNDEGSRKSAEEISLPIDQTAREAKLDRYEKRTAAYLIELRCRHLSNRHARKFWTLVVAEHKAAIGRFGAEAIELAKMRAQAFSSRQPCSLQSEEFVRGEFRDLAQQ
jgi:hypothetical protein